MRSKYRFALTLGLALVFSYATAGLSTETFVLEVHPQMLEIGIFFSGRTVNLSGWILTDRDIIIEIIGPDEKSKFNIKGKVGPFWMNREKVELEHAPFFYKLLLPENRKYEGRLSSQPVGIENLKQRITMKPKHLNFDKVFDLFLQFKHSEKLYEELNGAIRYSSKKEGKKSFEASFSFPSSTAPGDYKIVATLIDDDGHAEPSVRSFRVEEVGIIKAIRQLAYHRALFYGILSVIIALSVGALIGMVFKLAEAH